MEKLDQAHCATIDRILEALAADPALTVARALIACQDAFVALSFGLSFGLSVTQIATQAKLAHTECPETGHRVPS